MTATALAPVSCLVVGVTMTAVGLTVTAPDGRLRRRAWIVVASAVAAAIVVLFVPLTGPGSGSAAVRAWLRAVVASTILLLAQLWLIAEIVRSRERRWVAGVLHDAANELAAAEERAAVVAAVERAAGRLYPATARPQSRLVVTDHRDAAADPGEAARAAFPGLVAVHASQAEPGGRSYALLVDRRTASQAKFSVALQALFALAVAAVERLSAEDEAAQWDSARFGALIEQTADVILIVDDANRIRYASPAATTVLGTPLPQGVSFVDLVDAVERRSAEYLLRQARQRGGGEESSVSMADLTIHTVDGRTVRAEVRCKDLRSDKSVGGVVVTLRDVTTQRQLEHDLTTQVFRDPLTELPNQLLFTDRVGQAMAAGAGATGVFLLDMDNFKMINEGRGRQAGDTILAAEGKRLKEIVGERGMVARLSGDVFAVLLRNADTHALDELANRLTDVMALPVSNGGDLLSCSASVGVATSLDAATEHDLIRHAELALHAAKAAGRRRWQRYEPAMTDAITHRLELRSELSRALKDHALLVEYQPIVALKSGRTVGFEALVRWQHPVRGRIPPAEFIDIAEESGLIVPIGAWVLATALGTARDWRQPAPRDPPYVSANVSPHQFRSSGFVDTVNRLLVEARLPPDRLVLEITESLLLREDDQVWEDLTRLRRQGIRIAIDDFGTGYSALGYLRQVPLDIVKLDRSFISAISSSDRQRELVRGIVGLASTLKLEVVAEGIETDRERDIAAAIGCAYGQGFLFSRSISDADAAQWLVNERTGANAQPEAPLRPADSPARGDASE